MSLCIRKNVTCRGRNCIECRRAKRMCSYTHARGTRRHICRRKRNCGTKKHRHHSRRRHH